MVARAQSPVTSRTGRGARAWLAALLVSPAMLAGEARAADPSPGSLRPAASPPLAGARREPWRERYDAAREDLLDGRFRKAEVAFRALALEAERSGDRALALEMARLATRYAEREEAGLGGPGASSPRGRDIRTTDELTLLYATAFVYGVGSGAWFLLETQPDSALTATLPFAAITAAPVIAVATVDGYRKLPRGVPHALSAGLYLGLAEGVWLVGYQNARARRVEEAHPGANVRWTPETTTGVLWGAATTGLVLGGALGSSVVTTPGRVSFTASATIWSGAILGLAAGALLPDDDRRQERAFLAAGLGANGGLATGLLFAGAVSPSVARVRLVDLLGLAGGLATTGLYASVSSDVDLRLAEGFAALGAVAGLATGWVATSGMPKQLPAPSVAAGSRPPLRPTIEPSLLPVAGGATIGVAGML